MHIHTQLSTLDVILNDYKTVIGKNFDSYRNHCYRVYHFCEAMAALNEIEQKKLQIAIAFHDLGLFTDNTVDYLPPSMALADSFLKDSNLVNWQIEILLMIGEHHKVTPYHSAKYPLVEVLRKADLVDFSLGMLRHGVDKAVIKQVKLAFPNAGFHRLVLKEQLAWLKSHPTNPFPIFKF